MNFMEDRTYILVSAKNSEVAARRFMYVQAKTMYEAKRKAESSPAMRGWNIKTLQPTSQGKTRNWYTIY